MKKYFKGVISFFSIVFLIGGLGLFCVLNEERLLEKVVRDHVNQKIEGVLLESLNIGHQSFSASGNVYFHDIDFTIIYDKYSVVGKLKYIKLSHIEAFWGASDRLVFDIEGLSLLEESMKLNGGVFQGDVIFQKNTTSVDGYFKADMVGVHDFEMTDLEAVVNVDEERMEIEDLHFQLYGGRGETQVIIQNDPMYSFSMHSNFWDVDLELLGQDQPQVGENLKGKYKGDLNVEGDRTQLLSIFAHVDVEGDGHVRTSLVRQLFDLTNYMGLDKVTASLLKNNLRLAEQRGYFVGFEKFSLDIATPLENQLSYIVDVKSKQLTLDTHLTLDVPHLSLKDGIEGIYKIIGQYLK